MNEVRKLPLILRYLEHDMLDEGEHQVMLTQLADHLVEMNTLKEADLCGSSAVTERVFV